MRDVFTTLLLVLALVAWFSLNGPIVPVVERGLGPGDDRMGESPLVVSGPGAEIVSVTQAEARTTQAAREPEGTQSRAAESGSGAEAPKEEPQMDNLNELIWFAAGVLAVLTGMFAGPVVARMWEKIHNNNHA